MALSQLSQQLLATIAYCDQFHFPLTKVEVQRRLIIESDKIKAKAEARSATLPQKIIPSLIELMNQGVIGFENGFYFLTGSEEAVALRRERAVYSSLKWAEAREVVRMLSWLPWIKGVAVTGSLAMDNAIQEDDIDFFIITQENRLWLTRPVVILMAWLKGKRRSWRHEEKNSWCFNLWMEENELHSPGLNQSLYTAYEVCQAKFLLNRERVEERFIWSNQWVAQYLPFYFIDRCEAPSVTSHQLRPKYVFGQTIDFYFSWLLLLLNEVAFYSQWWYMLPHRTRERVTRSLAFFHPRDTQKLVDNKWQAAIKKVTK
ncbi:MAG TPA: hypothetical protein VF209_01755 [Patescibacteria group bacterium]